MQHSYEKSIEELESILRTIQSDKCDIDQLAKLTLRATVLIKACREKLTHTEAELKQILDLPNE